MDTSSEVQIDAAPAPPDPAEEKGTKVSRKSLVNKLNYVNFLDSPVFVAFRNPRYNKVISVPAKPQPCLDDRLRCTWLKRIKKSDLKNLHGEGFYFAFENKLINVNSEILELNEDEVVFKLPDSAQAVNARKAKRHRCDGVTARLIQNGIVFEGKLVDFSAVSFRIDLMVTAPQTPHWVTPHEPANVIFYNGDQAAYSGACKILKELSHDEIHKSLVLEPISKSISRFKRKEYRSNRYQLKPSPDVHFIHPLTREEVNLKVANLSGSGLSVEESPECPLLLSGMIIPQLKLTFANSFTTTCTAQVLYRKNTPDNASVRCGLAILDMPIEEHIKLLGLIHQADQHLYLCNKVNLNDLWSFFFESGFIYPSKYPNIKAKKEELQRLYEKIYNENPHFARHFIYQEKGRILGHMAMIRFYEKAWLIHHHAAKTSESHKAGIAVLNQIGRSINESHNLHSTSMDYVFCYFRPDNKFPRRVFAGAARHINDSKGCSLDTFAYSTFKKGQPINFNIDDDWSINLATVHDLDELRSYYEHHSGGLLTTAFGIDRKPASYSFLSAYGELGFKRSHRIMCLKKGDDLKAVFIIDISEVGLNMSELTSCIKVIVMDVEEVKSDILYLVLSLLSGSFDNDEIPVLVYPVSYVQRQSMPHKKLYTLWVLNLQYLDPYFEFCDKLLRST